VIVPVEALMVSPAVDEYVPPPVPVLVTVTGAEVVQNGLPLYAIVAEGACVMVTEVVMV
jgi:hypothetical protein